MSLPTGSFDVSTLFAARVIDLASRGGPYQTLVDTAQLNNSA